MISGICYGHRKLTVTYFHEFCVLVLEKHHLGVEGLNLEVVQETLPLAFSRLCMELSELQLKRIMRELPSLRIKGVSKVYPHPTLETPSIPSSQEDAELVLESLQGGSYFSRQCCPCLDISGGSKSFLS